MSRIWLSYQKILTKFPVLTQSLQAGLLMGTGDILSQTIVEKKYIRDINLIRTTQFASVGFLFGGPGLRIWYGILNKYVGSHGASVVMKKVALDQFLFAPVFLAVLLGTIGTMQGNSFEQTMTNVKKDYPDVLLNNYKVWPWVQLGNFYFVPLNYQVLLVQTVAVFWNTYLSWKTNKDK